MRAIELRRLLIQRARAAAADSRAIIQAQAEARSVMVPCRLCHQEHPTKFLFKGRERGWHQLAEAQMGPKMKRTRAMALVLARGGA